MQVTNQGCPSMLVQFSTNAVTTRGFVLLDLLNSLTDLLYMYYIIKFFSDRNNGNVVETVIFHMGVAVQQLSEMLMPLAQNGLCILDKGCTATYCRF